MVETEEVGGTPHKAEELSATPVNIYCVEGRERPQPAPFLRPAHSGNPIVQTSPYAPFITVNDGSPERSRVGGAQERRPFHLALVRLPVHDHHAGRGQSALVEAWIPRGDEQV